MKLLPSAIKTFIINRLLEIGGIISVSVSLFVLISIVSYSIFDPSIYNLSNYKIVNLGGYLGANISAILLQFFGYSSFVICIILLSWSYKLLFVKDLKFFGLNRN